MRQSLYESERQIWSKVLGERWLLSQLLSWAGCALKYLRNMRQSFIRLTQVDLLYSIEELWGETHIMGQAL